MASVCIIIRRKAGVHLMLQFWLCNKKANPTQQLLQVVDVLIFSIFSILFIPSLTISNSPIIQSSRVQCNCQNCYKTETICTHIISHLNLWENSAITKLVIVEKVKRPYLRLILIGAVWKTSFWGALLTEAPINKINLTVETEGLMWNTNFPLGDRG